MGKNDFVNYYEQALKKIGIDNRTPIDNACTNVAEHPVKSNIGSQLDLAVDMVSSASLALSLIKTLDNNMIDTKDTIKENLDALKTIQSFFTDVYSNVEQTYNEIKTCLDDLKELTDKLEKLTDPINGIADYITS